MPRSRRSALVDRAAGFAARADTVAVCLDFDGTLSPIVPNPEDARPLPGVVELLAELATRFAAVALLSGRPADYLAKHAPARGIRYLGLYGLQEIRDGQLWVDPRLERARPAVLEAQRLLGDAAAVRESGAYLEDKTYAVAVHTRRILDPQRWAGPLEHTAREIADRLELEVIPGKMVWELRPPVRSDKGDAVRRVMDESGARAVIVAGDDLGDIPAFTAAASLATPDDDVLRIAVRSAEAPQALLAVADLIVDGQAGLRDFLQSLLASRLG